MTVVTATVKAAGIAADPTGLDPEAVLNNTSGFVMATIYDGLIRYKPGTVEVEPGLAQSCGPVVTSAINDAFFATMIGCAVAVLLALLVGRDPALVAARRARQRGEAVPVEQQQPVLVGE